MTTTRVRTSDYDWFDVTFENGEPTVVVRSQVVWSGGRYHAGAMMNMRIEKVIALAKKEQDA